MCNLNKVWFRLAILRKRGGRKIKMDRRSYPPLPYLKRRHKGNTGVGLGQCSHYSKSLQSGRSGDQIPVCVRFSKPVQTGPGAHPASCTLGTGYLYRGQSGQSVEAPTPNWQRLKKSKAIPLLDLRAFTACSRMNFTLY